MFPAVELWLASLTLCFLFLGGFSISLARAEDNPVRAWWGRSLFIVVLVSLGITGLVGAFLQAEGLANPEIFARISAELASWRFRSPRYTERQIRRIIYG